MTHVPRVPLCVCLFVFLVMSHINGACVRTAQDETTSPETTSLELAREPIPEPSTKDAGIADAMSEPNKPDTREMTKETTKDERKEVTQDNANERCKIVPSGKRKLTRSLSGWQDRDYDLYLPSGYDCQTPIPVVVFIHGGGGKKEGAPRVACARLTPQSSDNLTDANCWNVVAETNQFAMVYPNGTRPGSNQLGRSFNAGGGQHGYACITGSACDNKIDDIRYFHALLDDLQRVIRVDTKRVYATGISNGGAMSHRLACQMPERIAAIAAIAGQAQHAISQPEECRPRPMPVLMMHGTKDTCYPYANNASPKGPVTLRCGNDKRLAASVSQSVSFWVKHNGCTATKRTSLPDRNPNDGSIVKRSAYSNCKANAHVILYTIEGGGHTWPNGDQYASQRLIGTTNRDFASTQAIWDFFSQHRLP